MQNNLVVKTFKRLYKLYHLGYRRSFLVIKNKLVIAKFIYTWRRKALNKTAGYSWNAIVAKNKLTASFNTFLEKQKKRQFAFADKYCFYIQEHISNSVIEADRCLKGYYAIFGSDSVYMLEPAWHTDVHLLQQTPQADAQFPNDIFYADIKIAVGQSKQLTKDVKVPWYLSCLRHVNTIGYAYKQTGNSKYTNWFCEHIDNWLDSNPFLLGVNWVSPLEVAIRAINLVWAFYFFKDTQAISSKFWERYCCSLYDHLLYLENNWETYDGRTNNHYLSNLVGYLYLLWFFKDFSESKQKIRWCWSQILKEFEWQIFDEGTSYEGSTAYHRLVTELFYHALGLAKELNLVWPETAQQKFERMCLFINNCFVNNNYYITIGDDDSGRVLPWSSFDTKKSTEQVLLSQTVLQVLSQSISKYSAFGLTFIKTDSWYMSLRHQAYTKRQPSGHFHNDIGSITLAVHDIPLIIDPCSYVYTASSYWRNNFRSVQAHNSFYIEELENIDTPLFELALEEGRGSIASQETEKELTVFFAHDLYKKYGIRAERAIKINKNTHELIIIDRWRSLESVPTSSKRSTWNFILAPEIRAQKTDQEILFYKQDCLIASLQIVEFDLQITSGWVAPIYGTKKQTQKLTASNILSFDKEYIFRFKSC